MEMAQYILSILRTQMCVVWSWGFHKAIAIEDGSVHEEHTDVYLDNLVDVIDRAVEKNGSQEAYVERVNAEYHV